MENTKNYIDTLKLSKSETNYLKQVARNNVLDLLIGKTSEYQESYDRGLMQRAENKFNNDSSGNVFDYLSNRVQNIVYSLSYRHENLHEPNDFGGFTISKYCPQIVKDFFAPYFGSNVTYEKGDTFCQKKIQSLTREMQDLEMKQIMIKREIANIKRQQGEDFEKVTKYLDRLEQLDLNPKQLDMINKFKS